MASIGFMTPIKFEISKTLAQTFLEIVDNYFSLSGRKVVVVESNPPRGFGILKVQDTEPFLKTALKILSFGAAFYSLYLLKIKKESIDLRKGVSLAIPLIAFVIKMVLRSQYRFYSIENPLLEFFGVEKMNTLHADVMDIPLDDMVRLSQSQMDQLQIKWHPKDRGHNLPQEANEFYSIPHPLNRGVSKLEHYEGSVFEFERKVDPTGYYYEVVRRQTPIKPTWKNGDDVRLTPSQLAALKILPRDDNRKNGYSILEEYAATWFHVYPNNDGGYNILPRDPIGKEEFLPFNEAIRVTSESFNIYLATLIEENTTLEPGVTWRIHEMLLRYQDSILLVKREEGNQMTIVRMLRPRGAILSSP